MTIKYIGNKNRKFTEKHTSMQVRCHGDSIRITFDNMPRVTAREIGQDIVAAMICMNFEVEREDMTELHLYDVDYGILSGFGEEEGISSLVKELCSEHGYIVECSTS